MLLRFRSFVPYTLPGVLALIGWWWYTSRKKDRLISSDGSEGPPTSVSRGASETGGRNGLVEKGTTPSPHEPLSNQKTQHDIISQIQVQDSKAAPSLTQSSEDSAPPCDRRRGVEVSKPSNSTLQGSDNPDMAEGSLKDPKDPESPFALTWDLDQHQVRDSAAGLETSVEEAIMSCRVTSSSTTPHLSGAERPEPEGEVAIHQSSVCALTQAKSQRLIPLEGTCLETSLSADVHKHILTSTPTSLTPAVQDSSTTSASSEDVHINRSTQEEEDLELLAAGLITEVISAAAQEVLGVASCKVTKNNLQVFSSSSTPLTRGQPCSLEELQYSCQQRSPSHGGLECREAADKEVPNGGSMAPGWTMAEAGDRGNKRDRTENGSWPTPLHRADPVLHMRQRGDEAAALAEDSACSTCYSEDGVSIEDLHSSTNQTDVIQVTDLSAEEVLQPQSVAETMTEAAEEASVDAVCVIKRLNGVGSAAPGTCEMDTDQSGGSDVNSMDSVDSGCTMSACESQSTNAASLTSDLVIWEIEVPNHFVGRLIGKQGRFVSFLKQNSGAKIYISTLPYTQEFQICHIEGVQQQVDKALSLIGKKFKDLDLTNLYAPPPPPLTLPSLPMTSWLLLPSGVTVEVIVVNIVSAGHIFVQQHTHPTYHALRSLDQQMFLCYSQPGTPALPSPAEVGVICAAPAVEGAWWRAQVITFYKESQEVEIRYVDYGGYDRVKIDSLRQIRSDFVTLPFQGAEVLLDNIAPLPGEDRFSAEATSALEEMTRGVPLLAQVSNYDNNTGLPLIQLWNMVGDEVILVNRTLAERNLTVWVDGF